MGSTLIRFSRLFFFFFWLPPRTYYSIDSISCQFTCQCDTNTPGVVASVQKRKVELEGGVVMVVGGGKVHRGVFLWVFIQK